MKDKLISVIVPCYNVEKHVGKCLDSILNQTYKNLEIIVIDDCSTDNTKDILEEYASKTNIKYFKNEKNMGAGYSRNIAVKEASSDIISFVDSDDFLGQNYYECLLKSMIENNSDVVICDIIVKYSKESGQQDIRSVACESQLNKKNIVNNGLAASPCNKLFKKGLLEKYPFAEGIMNEDVPAVLAIVINAKKVSYTKDTYYNYVQRDDSVQNTTISVKRFDIFKALDILRNRIKSVRGFDDYWSSIVFQQVIMFFIYVIPRESSLLRRYNLLKQFNKLSKKYNIRKNHLLWDFLESQGKYHKYYYKLLLKLNCTGFHFASSLLISLYKFYKLKLVKSVIKDDINLDDLLKLAQKQNKMKSKSFNISVVVPNYNYERFMFQRLYSILYQNVKIDELIILDDCSKDNSRELIDEIYVKLKPYIDIKKVYNEINSGSAFKQWEKGFELAKGDYIWIAEADDYCDKQFLKNVTKPLKKQKDIVISYTDTAFVNADGKIFMRSIKPEIDIVKSGHWDSSYINGGLDEINNYTYLNCTIANVSSVIFKVGKYSKYFKMSSKYKQAGDWLFYVNVMQHGKISYYNKPLNYYREHGNNVSSTTKKQAHMNEIKMIHNYFVKTFNLKKRHKKQIEKRYKFLEKVWNLE